MQKVLLKLFFLLCVFIVFSVSISSATTVSHRYIIPETEMTIEFPCFFLVTSSEMNDYEPLIYEWKTDINEARKIIEESGYSMMAISHSLLGISFTISVFPLPPGGEEYGKLTDEELQFLGDELSAEIARINELDEKPKSSILVKGNNKYASWGYGTLEDFTEHYFLVSDKNDCLLDIIVDYKGDKNNFLLHSEIVSDILSSIAHDYMNY